LTEEYTGKKVADMHGQNINIRIGGPMTPMVKRLMIINAAVFLIQKFVELAMPGLMEANFGLSHIGLLHEFKLWQLFTYMFLHGSWMHIIFNLLGLWMFAGELENRWGSGFFLRYYLYCGVLAGLFIAGMNSLLFSRYMVNPVTIGASGAIYGILLAYGITWPNREVYLYFLIPVRIKYLVLVFGLIEFFGTLNSATAQGGNISHIGHLGGLISGLLIILYHRKKAFRKKSLSGNTVPNPFSSLLKKVRLRRKRHEIDTRIQAKRIIDELLEKIARHGMSSLSAEEKKNLEWARKHYYPEGNDTVH
jgi:membrane associated rhomboid family serine protease